MTFTWFTTNEQLPTSKHGLTSGPVLFVVDGRAYAGYYHTNGWFYDDSRDKFMAKGHNDALNSNMSDTNKAPLVTEWCYLRQE